MQFATYEDFLTLAQQDKYYRAARWNLYSQVQTLIAALKPTSVLELGAYRFPLVIDCDTMDRTEKHNPTIAHDAEITPWPIPDKRYDLFVALQVWEHLRGRQQYSFREVRRVANSAILSFPYRWNCLEKDPMHHGITEEIIAEWTEGVAPEEVVIIPSDYNYRRIIYRFDFTRQSDAKSTILKKEQVRQKICQEPIPTLRREPEECRYLKVLSTANGANRTRCQFVESMFAKHGTSTEAPVSKEACQFCIQESEPTPKCFNTVVSSLIFSKIVRSESTGVDCSQLRPLKQRAENGLRMVVREPAKTDEQIRVYGDCLYFAAEDVPEDSNSSSKCSHAKHLAASPEICRLCADHRAMNFNEANSLMSRLPRQRTGKPVESWMVGMTTSPRKTSTIDQSLDSLIRAGWSTPWLFLDSAVEVADRHQHLPVTFREARTGAWSNYYLALTELMHRNPQADVYMLVQDDILLSNSENLREYLEQILWPEENVGVVSLFCSAAYHQAQEGWHIMNQKWVWGALAFLFSNQAAWEFIADPQVIAHRKNGSFDGTRQIDVVIGDWAQRSGQKILYPVPSLAQHIGASSTLWESATTDNHRSAEKFLK